MRRGVPILLYHRVGPRDGTFMDEYTVSPDTFARQMEQISKENWIVISLENMLDAGFQDRRRALVMTFDDGFASNREHAWPILERLAFPSATFIVTARLGQFNCWDGPSRALWPLLSADDIAAANPSLMTFHSHSETHPNLPGILHDVDATRRELAQSRLTLDRLPIAPGRVFAYPFGGWNWRTVREVRAAGYIGACTCMEGRNSSATNPFLLRRVEIKEHDAGLRLKLKLSTGRDLLGWPPARPPEIHRAVEWLREKIAGLGPRGAAALL